MKTLEVLFDEEFQRQKKRQKIKMESESDQEQKEHSELKEQGEQRE